LALILETPLPNVPYFFRNGFLKSFLPELNDDATSIFPEI
jgi:hypothetical protein